MSAEELAEYDAETVRLIVSAEQRIAQAEAHAREQHEAAREAKQEAKRAADELRTLIANRESDRGARPSRTRLDNLPEPAQWRARPIEELPIPDGIKAHLSFEPVKTAGELFDAITSFDPADGAPFGMALGDVAEVRMTLAELADACANAQPPADLSELWRDYPIERWTRFGLTDKDVERLAAGEVKHQTQRRPIVTVGDLSHFSAPTAGGFSHGYQDVKGIGTAGAARIAGAETKFWQWWNDGGQEAFARERGADECA